MTEAMTATVRGLVGGIEPIDDMAAAHRAAALQWLDGTDDIVRREKPRTPSPHLVSYFLLVDRPAASVLLCDHRLSGLWLPTGGHVEPGEHPAATVRREAAEELGVRLEPDYDGRPFFLTVTETIGPPESRHTDVSLWFALAGRVGQPLRPDDREFAGVKWWSVAELEHRDPSRFEPHLGRALTALGLERR